jgi:hypothetical protein
MTLDKDCTSPNAQSNDNMIVSRWRFGLDHSLIAGCVELASLARHGEFVPAAEGGFEVGLVDLVPAELLADAPA